jgi:hypothetical protein
MGKMTVVAEFPNHIDITELLSRWKVSEQGSNPGKKRR